MNSKIFYWHDNSRKFLKDSHALFGASKYSWVNYDEAKMIEAYNNNNMKKVGTELHAMACMLIKNKVRLPDVQKTINMYVNDAIFYDMRPEEQLYYSDLFFGTADAIALRENILRIHDLKTGVTKASMHQLEIYVAFFCLEYDFIPSDFDDIETRIYQNDEIMIHHPTTEEIVPIMDKIVTVNNIIQKLKEDERWVMN